MELPNGCRAQIGVADERSAARGVERNVSRKSSARIPHLLETLHARIECGLASTRKSHNRDAPRVNAGMVGENVEGAISIENHVEAAEQSMVGGCADDPGSRKD